MQEALIRAWRKRGDLRDPKSIWPWLARIVVNEALRIEQRRVPESVPDPEPTIGYDDLQLSSAPDPIDLARGLGTLADDERNLLRLRYELDLTQPAIAESLGVPEGTVKVRLHRARAQLRRALVRGPA